MTKKFPTTNRTTTISLSIVDLCDKCAVSNDCDLIKIREGLESIGIYIKTTRCPYIDSGFTMYDNNDEEDDVI